MCLFVCFSVVAARRETSIVLFLFGWSRDVAEVCLFLIRVFCFFERFLEDDWRRL